MTSEQVLALIQDADKALDFVLPLAGQAELVPVADALAALASKLEQALAAKKAANAVQTAVQAADAAADALENSRFPKG